MTVPLRLIMTTAGQTRFAAAQLGNATDLRVAAVGLTDSVFVAAPTLTALPGEFRRIGAISGAQVGSNIVHMIVRDDAVLTYQLRGFGLFLSDGTLFAVYSQATPIGQKSDVASLMLAIDIAFPAINVASITFGDTNFLNPPATTETKGVIELATDAEVAVGTDPNLAVSPKSLQSRLAAMFSGRRVNAAGLATGGGDLSGDVTITVSAATALEADAGTTATKAVTPASLVNILASIAARVQQTRRVNTSGLATGGASLSTDMTIDVPTATAAEAMAATIATKAVTPFSLSSIIAAIAAKVPLTRLVNTSGLAIGGNALSTDITISVPAATGAQLLAGTASNVAATPAALSAAGIIYLLESKVDGASRYRRFSDGSVEMMGVSALPGSEASFTLTFPWTFPTACDGIFATIINSGASNDGQSTVQEISLSAASAQLFAQNHKTPTADANGGFRWFARGH